MSLLCLEGSGNRIEEEEDNTQAWLVLKYKHYLVHMKGKQGTCWQGGQVCQGQTSPQGISGQTELEESLKLRYSEWPRPCVTTSHPAPAFEFHDSKGFWYPLFTGCIFKRGVSRGVHHPTPFLVSRSHYTPLKYNQPPLGELTPSDKHREAQAVSGALIKGLGWMMATET